MSTHSHRVLVVEDHPDACAAFEMIIEASGFDVVTASSGGEALERLRAGLLCCAVILDWWLPDMTGSEFLRQLRADSRFAHVAVGVCTGDARVRAEAEALGASRVFLKPAEPDELLDLVADHCPKSRDVA